jgi:Protein of unknown function (DUF3995)
VQIPVEVSDWLTVIPGRLRVTVLASCVAVLLAALGALHVYWALGGRWGLAAAVPEREGRPLFQPGRVATVGVATLLFWAGILVLPRSASGFALSETLTSWGRWAIAFAFLMRAIGDFRYAGFFKRVRGTRFADLDTRLYSPLCLALGLATATVATGGA